MLSYKYETAFFKEAVLRAMQAAISTNEFSDGHIVSSSFDIAEMMVDELEKRIVEAM